MTQYTITPIGFIRQTEGGTVLELKKEYLPAMQNLAGFGHLQVLWWFDGCDTPACRKNLVEESPYAGAPRQLGVFATRSPQRPNPIALTCCGVTYLDEEAGCIGLDFIDANDGSPVLDLKPYTPSLDRVEEPLVPQWCANWPRNVETSGDFDWGSVFQF